MSLERFPRKKYLDQLMAMRREFRLWRAHYETLALTQQVEWVALRMTERMHALEHAERQADQLRWTLEGMPRIS